MTLDVADECPKGALFINLCMACAYPPTPCWTGCGEPVDWFGSLGHHCRCTPYNATHSMWTRISTACRRRLLRRACWLSARFSLR